MLPLSPTPTVAWRLPFGRVHERLLLPESSRYRWGKVVKMSAKAFCEKAIAAHGLWKQKMRKCIAGELKLDPLEVEKPNVCDFGKWLESEGRAELKSDDFVAIHAAHANFHRIAATVVRDHASGRTLAVQGALDIGGSFMNASVALTELLGAVRDASPT